MDQLPPFLSNEPMEGDPPCHWADFLKPQLRRFPYGIETIIWRRHVGNGAEGYVARIRVGADADLGRLALKVFFYPEPLPRFDPDHYDHGSWSLENEALTVAVLEKVSAGLRASQSPIHVPAQRRTRLDALASLYACSVEGREIRTFDQLPADERTSLSELFESTRLRKCFGWIAIPGKDLLRLNRRISFGEFRPEKGDLIPSCFEPDKQYFGIVYEFIPAATREAPAMQRQIDFFYYAGFDVHQPANKENWQGPGIKLDFGDFITAIDPNFEGECCFETPTTAGYILGHRNTIDVDDDTFMDEIEEAQRQRRDPHARALAVERAFCAPYYAGGKRHRHPSQVSTRLPEDALTAVRVPEIEPRVVRKAWRAYRKEKLAYLAALGEAKEATEKKAEDEDGVQDE